MNTKWVYGSTFFTAEEQKRRGKENISGFFVCFIFFSPRCLAFRYSESVLLFDQAVTCHSKI